jgi:hypothetical protein
MEIVNTSYNGQGTNYQDYASQDSNLITSNYITPLFGAPQDYVEIFIYDLNNQILESDYNYSHYIPINPDPKNKLCTSLGIDPEKDVKNKGYNRGSVNIQYNFLKNLFNSSYSSQYWIKEISPSRKEIKLSSQALSNIEIQNGFNSFQTYIYTKNYYTDFYLNFGLNDLVIAVNAAITEENGDSLLLIKLYESLPLDFEVKSTLWLVDKIAESVSYNVNIQITADQNQTFQSLRGPNFGINVNQKVGQTTPFYNYTSLFSSTVSSSMQKIGSWYQDKAIQINVDYTNFSNFIHFSSATERIKNFVYKLQLIESYSQQIQAQNNVIGYGHVTQIKSASVALLENSVNAIIEKFDPYEYYLYYNSESFAWPKATNTQPYQLYSITSSQAINWLGSETILPSGTSYSLLFSASYYDSTNQDILINSVPQYLLDDSNNDPYIAFVNMVGQHFDNIWLYYKDVSNRYQNANDPYSGISKDLVADALKNFGIHLYTNTNVSDNLYYTLFGINEDGSLLPPTGSEVINKSGTNLGYVTSSIATISSNDVEKEIYKRLYHNLPYLLKTKGTRRGVKALIACFGIPDEILTVKEFGGYDRYSAIPIDGINNDKISIFTSSLLEISSSGLLRPDTTIQYYSNDTRKNSIDIEVGFSPADQINAHITGALPNFVIDNYIGAPDTYFSSSYAQLDLIKRNYFNSYYSRRYNIWDYIRLIKYFNNAVFKMIKDFVPARTDVSSGIIIKSHILERSKYARHEPIMSMGNNVSQSIDMLRISGSDAAQIKFNTTKTGFHTSSIGYIPYTSSTGVEKINGQFKGSNIKIKNTFSQTEVSQVKNFSYFTKGMLTSSYYSTSSLVANYQNVTSSLKSKRYLSLDYSYNKNTPVNFGIITQSMLRLSQSRYNTYNDPNVPMAYLQDYNYSTNAYTIPRYYGSKTRSSLYTYYVQGETGSYGNTAAIDKQKYQYAYLVDIYSSSILMPKRCNAQIKYIIDNNENVLDLTKANTNIFYTQNIFKSGESVNISLFDYDQKNPDVRYLTNNSGLSLYEGGFVYFPMLHNLSGSDVSFTYNLPDPIQITQTIAGGSTPPSFGAVSESNVTNYGISGNGYTISPSNTISYTFNVNYYGGGTISTNGGVVLTLRIGYQKPPNWITTQQGSGNISNLTTYNIAGKDYFQFDVTLPKLLSTVVASKVAIVASTPIPVPPNILTGENSIISVIPSPSGGSVTNPQTITTYVSSVTDPQTCLYYQTSSYSLVFSNTIANYYDYGFVFDSYSDSEYVAHSNLFQAVNTPFSLKVGDQIHFYTESLGWTEKEEYVVANSYVSGAGTDKRLYVTLNRPLNLGLLSVDTIDAGSLSNTKVCRFIALKHVPDETNLILRYAPTTNIVQDGLVFPQYIEQPVKDSSGNVIKSLKSQNLI